MTPPTRDEAIDPCEGYISLIVRAADDCLDADGRTRLETHLAACDACRAALDFQRESRALLASAFDLEPPLGFTTRVVANLEHRERWLDRLDFRRLTWRVSPVAAGLVLAAWVLAASSETTSASGTVEVVSAAESGVDADAVLWSDAIGETDLVSIAWDEMAGSEAIVSTQETTP